MKVCRECNVEKDFESFYKSEKCKGGFWNICKPCWSLKKKERFKAQPKTKEPQEKECVLCHKQFKTRFVKEEKCYRCHDSGYYECQECFKPKTKSGIFCRRCSSLKRSGAGHHNWKNFSRRPTRGGYADIYMPGHPRAQQNYVAEHIYVMEQHIGRFIFLPETVHHKNGIRDDNRLENLELWASKHPPGQRILDQILWAEKFLEEYGYLKEKLLEMESMISDQI